MRHDVEHHVIGLVHAVMAQTSEVADRIVDIPLREAIASIDNLVMKSKFCTYESTVEACRHLEGTRRFGAVADHAGQGVDHVLDGIAHLVVVATMQVGDAAGDTYRGIDDAAQR